MRRIIATEHISLGETGDGYTLDEALASEVLLLGLDRTHGSAPNREPVQRRD
jgi:hypothetical protein